MSSNAFEPVIGLEIHLQLNTLSKLFCGCSAEASRRRDVPPNTHICPICVGHPGTLPRPINRRAVVLASRLALACHGAFSPSSAFDRKNYFYADLPKGYQITQHGRPLATGGWVDFLMDGETERICIDHMHLEEDPGRSKMEGGVWLVDMNRCGTPLVEVVTRPDLRSAREAAAFVEEFRRIARYLEVSEANMEMGNLRCDANVSLRPAGTEALGVKTEIKNLNSFRFLEEAITWEIERQKRELEAGRPVRQITIHWDERHGRGRLSREKETAADYRYFREPNLIPVVLDEGIRNEAASDMPTLPSERMRRYTEQGIDPGEAAVLVEDRRVSDYFERVVSAGSIPVKRAADWVRNHVLRVVNDPGSGYGIADLPMTPVFLTELLDLMRTGVISEAMGPALFQKTLDTGRSPKSIVDEEGLRPPERNDLIGIVDQAINDDMESVQKFREGNEKAINRLIGLVMRHTQGRASAQQVRDMLIDRIKGV